MNDRSDIAIEFDHVAYAVDGSPPLLSDLTFSVARGEILMLLGRSGSGKTTTLKLINRLLLPSAGEVRVQERSTRAWDPIRLRRGIGYAIQDVGLFPHYTVADNVGLIPRAEGWPRNKVQQRVAETLALVGLSGDGFAARYPHQLSGGQRQRVGLARALAADPPILLMDEAFGALDPLTRLDLQREFKELQTRLHKTVVFVTHDVTEALLLGNRIALLETGKLIGIFTSAEFLASSEQTVRAYADAFRAGSDLLHEHE